MKTPRQTDVVPSVYVSNPAGANRVLPLAHIGSVGSTNTECLLALRQVQADDWCAVWTDDQTAGRGRQGRQWVSQPGCSLCLSVGRRLPAGFGVNPALPVAVGAAAIAALQTVGCPAQLKWPNDLMLGGRKLGGILCESSSQGCGASMLLVVGLGLNLRPVELIDMPANGLQPVSLSDIGINLPLTQLAALMAQRVTDILAIADQPAALSDWCSRADELDVWKGRSVLVSERGEVLHHGLALGIATDGQYRLETEQGELRMNVGELSLRERA